MSQRNCFHIEGDRILPGIPFNCGFTNNPRCLYVGFDTENLDFEGPFAIGFYLYPGGEWHNKQPVWSQGKDRNDLRPERLQTKKMEVWELGDAEKIGIADRRNGLRILEHRPDTPVLIIPTPTDVERYLFDRAQAMVKRGHGTGLNWVRQSLRAIWASTRDPIALELHQQVKLM